MRKRIFPVTEISSSPEWLDLEPIAQVEVTSEDVAHPIEAALTCTGIGWRAAKPGAQIIRLLFDDPQQIHRVVLTFREELLERTQEFLLRWSSEGKGYADVVRQQYHFSPPGTTCEIEDYHCRLENARALELRIVPDIAGRAAHASLAEFRIA